MSFSASVMKWSPISKYQQKFELFELMSAKLSIRKTKILRCPLIAD